MASCVCEERGYYNSGVPGIIAHVEHGQFLPEGVERCDACQRIASDEAALEILRACMQSEGPSQR